MLIVHVGTACGISGSRLFFTDSLSIRGAVTLFSKYQLAIPKAIREELGSYAGQKLALIVKGSVIELIPQRPIEEF